MSSEKYIPLQAVYGIRLLEHLQQHGSVPFEGLATTLDIPYGQLMAIFRRFKTMGVVSSKRQYFCRKQKNYWILDKNADVDCIIEILRLEGDDTLQEGRKHTEQQTIHEDAENLPAAIWDKFLRGKI